MAKRKNINNYEKKQDICKSLVKSEKTHITDEDVVKYAKEHGIDIDCARRAWKNFVENGGIVDKRSVKKNEVGSLGIPYINKPYNKSRNVGVNEAAEILLKMMVRGNSAPTLSNEYKVSVNQIYSWVNELEVSGELLGVTILDPTEYSKPNLLDAMAYRKNPYSKNDRVRKLDEMTKLNYKRVTDILIKYLTPLAERNNRGKKSKKSSTKIKVAVKE